MLAQPSSDLHARIILKAPTQFVVPKMPDAKEMAHYKDRFSSSEQIDNNIKKKFTSFSKYINSARKEVKSLLDACKTEGSSISANILAMEEDHLLLIFEAVAAMGLKRFAPDFLGDPNSIYNLIHERVCIFTFRQIASSFGYAFMGCDLSQVEKPALLTVLYRNFVFGYMAGNVKKEVAAPGRLLEDIERDTMYSRRSSVRSFPYFNNVSSWVLSFVIIELIK